MALFLQQQREGQQGPWVGWFFFSQLAIERLRSLRGSALAEKISQQQTDLHALACLQALEPGGQRSGGLALASLLLIQQHQQLQNLRVIWMQAHQLLEAAPGCFGLAIAALQLRFEQMEFARGEVTRQPRLQHHFGLQ